MKDVTITTSWTNSFFRHTTGLVISKRRRFFLFLKCRADSCVSVQCRFHYMILLIGAFCSAWKSCIPFHCRMFRGRDSCLLPISPFPPSILPWITSCWKEYRSPRSLYPNLHRRNLRARRHGPYSRLAVAQHACRHYWIWNITIGIWRKCLVFDKLRFHFYTCDGQVLIWSEGTNTFF